MPDRSGKGKQTRNSNEAEYRIIFDNLISDLLVVLFWPEWPAASLLLTIACKYMVRGPEHSMGLHFSDIVYARYRHWTTSKQLSNRNIMVPGLLLLIKW